VIQTVADRDKLWSPLAHKRNKISKGVWGHFPFILIIYGLIYYTSSLSKFPSPSYFSSCGSSQGSLEPSSRVDSEAIILDAGLHKGVWNPLPELLEHLDEQLADALGEGNNLSEVIPTDHSYWCWWWNAPVLERVPLSKVPGTENQYENMTSLCKHTNI